MNTKEERLLKAIFDTEEAEDDYPATIIDKVGYAEYVLTHDLEYIGKAINRLGRLHRLLVITEKDGKNELPDIITNNELRMALEPLLRLKEDVVEISETLLEIYKETKQEKSENSND